MNIEISKAREISNSLLIRWGFSQEEAEFITENLIEGELADKKTHGLVRLLYIQKKLDGEPNLSSLDNLKILSETPTSLHIDGDSKIGLGVLYKSLDLAFNKVKQSKLLAVGIKNVGLTGYIGAYARKATDNDLIFLGFNNSPGGLIPHGSLKDMLGTNPLTVGIPSKDIPVILDMASSIKTFGDLLVAKNEGKSISEGVAVNAEGKVTTDPSEAMKGGLLPFAQHKGSGLGFIVELLGGALTGSRVGYDVSGGWGSFYILIDPTLFRPLDDFKADVSSLINELKNSPKMQGFDEIYFAGERSHKIREKYLKSGEVEISDKLYSDLQGLLQ